MPTSDEEDRLLAALKDSEFWKYIVGFLDLRRESLFIESAETPEKLWRQKGAIDEITRLKHMPALILEKHRLEREQQREQMLQQLAAARSEDGYDG